MSPSVPGGMTPIDPDEARALIPRHSATQDQLNEWEHQNILESERWALSRRRNDLLTPEFMQRLHHKMFGDTWRWAGTWRTKEKNIGITPDQISTRVGELLDDVAAQLKNGSYRVAEIAARCHHRLVQIHPFPNGNGRFARGRCSGLSAAV